MVANNSICPNHRTRPYGQGQTIKTGNLPQGLHTEPVKDCGASYQLGRTRGAKRPCNNFMSTSAIPRSIVSMGNGGEQKKEQADAKRVPRQSRNPPYGRLSGRSGYFTAILMLESPKRAMTTSPAFTAIEAVPLMAFTRPTILPSPV